MPRKHHLLRLFLLCIATLWCQAGALTAPGDILFQDDFNRSNVATGNGTGSTDTHDSLYKTR